MGHRTVSCLAALLSLTGTGAVAQTDWPTYGHDAGGMRFSPLAEITPENVATLAPAWTYHMRPTAQAGDANAARRGNVFLSSQVTPLVIGNVMYLTTPYQRVVALDATTGAEIWVY